MAVIIRQPAGAVIMTMPDDKLGLLCLSPAEKDKGLLSAPGIDCSRWCGQKVPERLLCDKI